ncbi:MULTISPECIES: hypothetical protein [Pseudomonas]|uniref:Uncharacterized protein n=1 Tax=Pseudomonas donghuensis TaxID=1163398 RepID=A0AAP0XAA2_9PSED|nr:MULTISPECIES: hypothetical protein [Pseudomonas]MDF9893504.1 hypothetical protein [Pseudomonas vranovensis]KDN98882.2 hypothetical protein BV82_3042 [Pseudomonas donghuensis]MCP6694639.1 hypothetical protein [Pseudomonas donghuensis]PJY96054.1 hypothetical protein COO64_14695 [Pseudomonas donghuensis]QHF28610.1 hypothetical protein PspR32_12690 [Pseudomonas sp. R32]
MIAFTRQLLPAALLCSALGAHASEVLMGDFWVVHYQGALGKNQVFIADGDPNHIVNRPGGAKSLGVYQLYEEPGKPNFTAYDVEIDCAKNRVRIMGAADFRSVFNELRNAKYSSQWQSKPDAWLAQSRDFVCKPTERQAKKMEHLGVMSASQMSKSGPQFFQILNREAAKTAIMQKIDEGFTQMSAK